MNKLWFCVGFTALLGVLVLGNADGPVKTDYEYYNDEIEKDYQNKDEGDESKPSELTDTDGIIFKDNVDDSGEMYVEENDQAVKILKNSTSSSKIEESDKQGDIDDYQIEDNRSEVREDKFDFGDLIESSDDIDYEPKDIEMDVDDMDIESDEVADNNAEEMNDDDQLDEANDMIEDSKDYDEEILEEEAFEDAAENIANNDDIPWESPVKNEDSRDESNKNDDDKPLNVNQGQDLNMKQVFDDKYRIYNETEDDDDDFSDVAQFDSNQESNIQQIIDETEKILNGTYDSLDEDTILDEKSMSSSVESAESRNMENISSTSNEDYNIDEDTLAKAYSDLKKDLNELHDSWMKLKDDVTDANINKENLPGFDELDTKLADMEQEQREDEDEEDYEVIDDKDLFKLFKEVPEEDIDDEEMDELQEKEADEIEPTIPVPAVQSSDQIGEEKLDNSKLIKYVDDALSVNDVDSSNNIISTTKPIIQEHKVEPLDDTPNDELDIFGIHEPEKTSVEPIRITLSLDTPVVITSPNFPSPYPTNAVIDWIFEGEGMGIEFNVTDFALNSIAGDYVMVKPGRVDASGSDGFLISYTLNTPRLFRFLDVNRMFIRFDSRLGLNRFRGFRFSIKMINPLPEEKISEPEVLPIGYPHSTIMVNLGGITLEGFLHVEEEFRQIVADMATMYIEANQIDPGLNTTLEVTQITSTALCFHNWPQFEHCAEVRFGVPLQYEDEEADPRLHEDDLRDMWLTYSGQNPFALRLQRLGIMDFQIPNDSNVLMVWLVIAAGVVISMAMLAFALWRFSCFEDYTRMPSFSDTESVNEKKTLDLYPTPHQTLPPLYSDTEYKWGEAKYEDSTRVDMSGFQNRSYVRTEDYDFDSEDEGALPARDRYTTDV